MVNVKAPFEGNGHHDDHLQSTERVALKRITYIVNNFLSQVQNQILVIQHVSPILIQSAYQ